jgi:hypothetical protein
VTINSEVMPDEERYRIGPLRRFPLDLESEIVYLPLHGRVCVLPTRETARLGLCSDFLGLAEHAENIVRHVSPTSDPREMLAWLREQVDSGALIRYSDVIERCTLAAEGGEATHGVDWLAVPTRSRPGGLLEAVRSCSANARAFDRRTRLFVSDQSQSADMRHESRAALREYSRETGVEVMYAGEEEKSAYAKELASDGHIPPDTLLFALSGCVDASANFGANRNAILLQTVGTMFISVDDDMVCETASAPGTLSEVRFGSELDPTELWFFNDRASAREFMQQQEMDFVGAHSQLLGRRVGDILARTVARGTFDLTSMCHHIWEHLFSDGGQVLSTYGGFVGDAGVYSAFPFMVHANRPTKERLTAAEYAYRQNVRSREIVRQTLAPTVSHGPTAAGIAMFFGLDNRELLPPFFPPYRNEDGIFAQMLARCREGSCIGHVPVTMLHNRPEGREFGDVETVRMSDLVMSAMGSCAISLTETSCADRLKRFGNHLICLGTLPAHDFEEWVRMTVLARASGIATVCDKTLKRDYCYPEYWAADLSATVERLSRAALDPNCFVPEELRDCGGLSVAKEIMRQFGELLRWWPAIVERARCLAGMGIQVGCRLG